MSAGGKTRARRWKKPAAVGRPAALRHLAIVDPKVRAARTAARRAQIARIREFASQASRSYEDLAAALLKAERICDAAAEGELADLGLSPTAAKALVAAAVKEFLGSPD
jgi:hypothetical protein